MNKVDASLSFPYSCIGPNIQTTPTKTATTTIALYSTPNPIPVATTVGTYLNLIPTEYIYAEIINFSLDLGFGFRSAENLGCLPPPAVFSILPIHIQILVDPGSPSTDTTVTYDFPGAA